jgi:signal transduction histidine kinase
MAWQDIFEHAYNNPEQWQKGMEIKIDMGKFKYGLLRIIPSNNHIGKMISWLCTIQDLTEKKNMEQQRDEMMRFLSHDMRSPQSSIIASIELHRKNKDYKPVEEVLLKKIESHAYRTLTLAEEFVQLAKAEAQAYNNEYVNMSNLVMDSVDDMWSLAKQKNIKIKQELIDDVYVMGDRLLLARCITNLLSNAIKYTFENRQVWVKISIRDEFVAVDVIDEGPGITKDNQKKLFERFVRFEETKHVEGIGLGLSFVKVVIDKHNGRIECRSEYGHGCQFSILLPVAPPDEVV